MIKGLFNLEKVSKRPVSQHLKEGVMVGIFSNIVKVTVLPSSSNAPLRVGSTNQPSHVASRVYTILWKGERKGGKEGRKEEEQKKKECRLLRDQLKAGPKIGNCSNGEQGSG